MLDPSVYPDTFARDGLPPPELMPVFEGLEALGYPKRFNAAVELIEKAVAAGFGRRLAIRTRTECPCTGSAGKSFSWAAVRSSTNREVCSRPKMSGKMYSEILGQLHFWVFFVGVNVLFFPMHFLGLQGMPRRYPDYPAAFEHWNHIASAYGYTLMLAGMVVFFLNVIISLAAGKKAVGNPWGEGATTLEWTLSSPPPYHQFETLPKVD